MSEMNIPEHIVSSIINDLQKRPALDKAFGDYAHDYRIEIAEDWVRIVEDFLKTALFDIRFYMSTGT